MKTSERRQIPWVVIQKHQQKYPHNLCSENEEENTKNSIWKDKQIRGQTLLISDLLRSSVCGFLKKNIRGNDTAHVFSPSSQGSSSVLRSKLPLKCCLSGRLALCKRKLTQIFFQPPKEINVLRRSLRTLSELKITWWQFNNGKKKVRHF